MENDRFMVTKKVVVDRLPETVGRNPDVNDQAPVKIERSAADVHEAYIKRVKEMRTKKKEEDDARQRAAAQENMISNFVKKKTMP